MTTMMTWFVSLAINTISWGHADVWLEPSRTSEHQLAQEGHGNTFDLKSRQTRDGTVPMPPAPSWP